ncbi:MAG: protein translocase subunit SecF [Hyphomicrobiales bacterium]|nr:protein translocase subunit SecF [Hyphomicrobiales bacterium]
MRLIPFKPVVFVKPGTRFSFVTHYKIAVAETLLLIVATIVLLSTLGLNFGIDFRGGTLMEVRASSAVDIADIRQKVAALGLGETQIQTFGSATDVAIKVAEQPGGDAAQQAAVAKIRDALGPGFEVLRADVVGGTVSDELVRGSIIALTVAAVGIFLFVWLRFEWQFSVAAIVALLHDVLATLCVLSLLQIDFDLTVVAAILTLIGYAVNDTVVMFDRIRENLRKFKRMPLDQLIDLSINETLSRTVMTLGSVLITLVALFFFGGQVIHGFILTLLVGTAVSAYTSLFVAAPLLYLLGVKRDWGTAATAPGRKPSAAARPETDDAANDADAEPTPPSVVAAVSAASLQAAQAPANPLPGKTPSAPARRPAADPAKSPASKRPGAAKSRRKR